MIKIKSHFIFLKKLPFLFLFFRRYGLVIEERNGGEKKNYETKGER